MGGPNIVYQFIHEYNNLILIKWSRSTQIQSKYKLRQAMTQTKKKWVNFRVSFKIIERN